jgi:cytochrome c-type biogenesis protein
MEPVIMALKQHYGDEVAIIVADLDNPRTERLLEEFAVFYIPAFYFIDANGVVVSEEAGVFSFEEMILKIDPIAAAGADREEREQSWLEYFFSDVIPLVIGQRTLLTLLVVFLGGLVTSISPCILSMVPLLVSYIGGYGEGPRSKGFFLSGSFIIGLSVTFAFLGFIAAYFGRIFGQIGIFWYYILAAVAIVMGLQLIGVLTFNLPGLKKIPVKKAGIGGAALMGMLFGLIASPCATPVLAVIITYAAVQADPFYGSGLLFIYGLGHGMPLLAAGTFTGLARNLPKINKYTHYLGFISGFVLIIFGLILLIWASGY